MSKQVKAMSLMLLMCFSSQIKPTDADQVSTHEVELCKQREDLLNCMIKYYLVQDFEDDHFDKIRNALSTNNIRRRLIGFLAITPPESFADASSLFEGLLGSNLVSNELTLRPIFLAPKFIEIKKSIIENAYWLFQDWHQASRLSKDFVENRDILTYNFETVLARLTVYLYLLRLSGDPKDLYKKASDQVLIDSRDNTKEENENYTAYCEKAFKEIYDALKPYV